MSELNKAFSPVFNEAGFEARIDWDLSRGDFAKKVKELFEELKKRRAAIPTPVAADIGPVTCILAGVDCKGCAGLCCTRSSKQITLSASEAHKLGIKVSPDRQGQIMMPLPCKFFKKGQCSIYSDRPAACRLYPVQVGGSGNGASGRNIVIGLDSYCPESMRIGLRLYLATYDLAHVTKNESREPS